MAKRKSIQVQTKKNLTYLLFSVFVLSVFLGVILNMVIRYWFARKLQIAITTQRFYEAERLEKLLNSYSF